MKKYILSMAICLAFTALFAKKVKFAVDMTGQTVNATGMHVFGDFQEEAGFSLGDWQPNTTSLTLEDSATNIYSIVVDIPAFRVYEYKFLNGDQSYDIEFVPLESRVGYNFDDNRWLYVDSLADDTTFAGAILFSGNAPVTKLLVRFYVDMTNEVISPLGVHVAGNYQGNNPATNRLYSFGDSLYEIINYVDSNAVLSYKYYNGNTTNASEIVPAACASGGSRSAVIGIDTLFNVRCFSGCDTCTFVAGIKKTAPATSYSVYPNPASGYVTIQFSGVNQKVDVVLVDVTGRVCQTHYGITQQVLNIERGGLPCGIYTVWVKNNSTGVNETSRVIFK